MKNYLNFETNIKELEAELENLKDPYNKEGLSEVDTNKISKLQEEIDTKLKHIYSNLDPWQKTMVARHEDRPKSKYFIENIFSDFIPTIGLNDMIFWSEIFSFFLISFFAKSDLRNT